MAIEGPLRELGIHDVFQLLDLSRKTGVLRVSSQQRDDEGTVGFDSGRVVFASIRSKDVPLELGLLHAGRINEADLVHIRALPEDTTQGVDLVDRLVRAGALTQRELERHVRQQMESVVFELMSWREGYFSFEERSRDEMPRAIRVAVSTESLLMEGARRIDEWSRIANTIPSLDVVPELAPVATDREGSLLDLLPHEWQALTMIDGSRDLRSIAAALARDEFEVAKIAYGLVRTGVIVVRVLQRTSTSVLSTGAVETAGRLAEARAHTLGGRDVAALDELRRAVRTDPLTPEVHRALGFAAARTGDLRLARSSWEHYLRLVDGSPEATTVLNALDALNCLTTLLDADASS